MKLSRTPLTSVDNGISEGCRVNASFNIYPVCVLLFVKE